MGLSYGKYGKILHDHIFPMTIPLWATRSSEKPNWMKPPTAQDLDDLGGKHGDMYAADISSWFYDRPIAKD